MTQPSVTITLSSDGSLQVGLPGVNGTLRVIPLRETQVVNPTETIRRILLSQAQSRVAIGEDGAPTREQVRHWEKHFMFPDGRCPFCQFDAAVVRGLTAPVPHKSSHQFDARFAERKLGDSGVTVRRIPSKQTAKRAKAEAKREAAMHPPSQVKVDIDF